MPFGNRHASPSSFIHLDLAHRVAALPAQTRIFRLSIDLKSLELAPLPHSPPVRVGEPPKTLGLPGYATSNRQFIHGMGNCDGHVRLVQGGDLKHHGTRGHGAARLCYMSHSYSLPGSVGNYGHP